MIESILINNFRGIQTGRVDDFRRFNLLVGPNNAGKSTLMEALYLASTATRPANLTVQYENAVETYEVKVSRPDLLGQHPLTKVRTRHNYAGEQAGIGANNHSPVRWSQGLLRVTVKDRHAPISAFDLSTPPGDEDFSQGEERLTALFSLEAQKHPDDDRYPVVALAKDLMQDEVAPFVNKRLLYCWHPDLTYYYRGSAAWLVAGAMPAAQQTLFFDTTTAQGHLPLAFYERTLAAVPGWSQQIARRLGRIFELNGAFTVQFLPTGPDRQAIQGWIAPEDRSALPIDALGDGARTAFKLLTPLTAMANGISEDTTGILLWEEPELFQNPKTLGRFLAEVVDIVRDRPIQVFMVSHSLEVVAHLTTMLQEGKLSSDDALVFRLDLRDGQLHSSWFDADNLITWLETGLDPRAWGDFTPPLQFRLQRETA